MTLPRRKRQGKSWCWTISCPLRGKLRSPESAAAMRWLAVAAVSGNRISYDRVTTGVSELGV
jgi:hypothetical protein